MPQQLQALIDDRVFNFAQGAQKHYRTNDLVVFLDLMEDAPSMAAIPRERLAEADEVPEAIRRKLAAPASELAKVLGSPLQSFWFFVIYESGDAHCVALNASMLVPGGTA